MKYTAFVLLIGLIAGGSLVYHASTRDTVVNTDGMVAGVSEHISPTPQSDLPEDTTIIPVSLNIQDLDLRDVVIEHVSLDDKKRMDVPKDPLNVAWYKLGAKPGQKGSAVLAGHFDLSDGSPGVFADIGELQNGDRIEVFDENGKTLTFKVVDKETFSDAEFPIDLVFGDSDTPRLNLITCAGEFDKSSKNYSHRLVVFAKLVREEVE